MLNSTTIHQDHTSAYALGHAHRRARIFQSWMYGMILALPGAAYAVVALIVGESPETGVIMGALGLGLSGVGWLATVRSRFSRKCPRQASDFPRADQAVRIGPMIAITGAVATWAACLALALLTPRGMAPDVVPILAMMAGFPVGFGLMVMGTRPLIRDRDQLFQRWLEEKKPTQ